MSAVRRALLEVYRVLCTMRANLYVINDLLTGAFYAIKNFIIVILRTLD